MIASIIRLGFALLIVQFTALKAAEPAPLNTLLGTQAIGGRYQFSQDEPLLESAKLIAELGSGIMKFSISKEASFGKTKANVLKRDPSLKTLAEVAAKERFEKFDANKDGVVTRDECVTQGG